MKPIGGLGGKAGIVKGKARKGKAGIVKGKARKGLDARDIKRELQGKKTPK